MPSAAQVAGGSVTGRVTDAAGANLPNVRIELENIDTSQRIAMSTDASGAYTFNNVPPGRYRVITTGSTTTTPSQEIMVDVSRTNTINITVPSGPGTDALVQTEAVTVSTKPASILDVWNTRYIHYLPQPNLVDRMGNAFGAYNLSILTGGTGASLAGSRGGIAIAGQRPETNLFHVDGIDNRNLLTGGPLTYVSNEASTEFSLMQNQNAPLFGHSGGANYNTIVRTGTNRAHGSVYNYLQNRWFNATDRAFAPFGYNENNQPRFDQNRMGGSLGIPLVPGKVFFFGNFEYIPLGFDAPVGGFITAPTASGFAALNGIRAVSASNLGILRNAIGANAATVQTGTTSVGGVDIPVGLVANNQRNWQNQMIGTGSLDFNMSDKDQFRFRYVHNDIDRSWSGSALTSARTPAFQRSLLASAAHYHTFGNAVTNELRFGFNRVDSEQFLVNGLTPAISIGSGLNLNLGPQYSPAGIINTFHLADGVNFRIGAHQLKVGFDGRRYQGFRDNVGNFAGNYGYSTLERFLLDVSPDVTASRAFGVRRTDMGQNLLFGYVHDTWTMAPGYTLDLGARYQYAQIPQAYRAQGDNNVFDVPGLISFRDPQVSRWNFSPYAGIALSPWQSRTVVRAGFGMHYDATYWQPFTTGFAPAITNVATGNLNSNGLSFLANGGLTNNTGSPTRAGITSYIQDQRMPYSMQWNAAVQQAIWRNSTIEVKYLGNRGVRQPVFGQLNYAGVTQATSLPVFSSTPTQAQLNALTTTLPQLQAQNNAFAAAGFTSPISTVGFNGNSWYHAAVVSLNHNFTGGFQMNANYTWSRWEDDSTGTPLDIGSPTRMRQWSMYDRRHQANVTGLFEVAPLFRDSFSLARNVFADFTLSGSYRYALGSALTPVSGLNSALANNAFGTGVDFNPDATGNTVGMLTPLRNSGGSVVGYLQNDPNARFTAGAPGVYSAANRNTIRLRDIHNIDVAAVKRFNFAERASIELRGEAYNLFNRPQPGVTGLSSMGGSMSMLGPIPGTIDVNNLANLNVLPSNPRTLQLALRVTF